MRAIPVLLGPVNIPGGVQMDAVTERTDLSYAGCPAVLIGASSDAALVRARCTVEAGGCRVSGAVALEATCERIEQQIAAAAIWIELDRVLRCVGRTAAERGFAAVVSSSPDILDAVCANVDDAVELIVDADDAERSAALAIAPARAGM